MEWPKVKNIIILILALLDAFLLVLVLGRQRAVRQYERSAVTGAVRVLEQNGIAIAEDAIWDASAPHEIASGRDLEAEKAFARSLLGEDAQPADQGGGLYAYSTDRGTALLRAGGDLSVQFTGSALSGQTPEAHAAALLRQAGLEGELLSAPGPGEDGEAVFCQTVDGTPVYSCRLVFRYREGRLEELSGTAVLCSTFSQSGGGDALDISNALIRFMAGVLERGDLCSSVTALRPGYQLTQSFGADLHLSPVWLVATDVGSYYLDGVTGELRPAEP